MLLGPSSGPSIFGLDLAWLRAGRCAGESRGDRHRCTVSRDKAESRSRAASLVRVEARRSATTEDLAIRRLSVLILVLLGVPLTVRLSGPALVRSSDTVLHPTEGPDSLTELVQRLSSSSSADEHAEIVREISMTGRAAIPILMRIAEDGASDLGVAAIRMLPEARPRSIDDARFLRDVIRETPRSSAKFEAAADSLRRYGVDGLAALAEDPELLSNLPWQLKGLASDVGRPSAMVLARAVSVATEEQLPSILRIISRMGSDGDGAIPQLIERLPDAGAARPALLRCIGRVGGDSTQARDALLDLLEQGDYRDTLEVLPALSSLQFRLPSHIVPSVLNFVETGTDAVAVAAAYRLLGRAPSDFYEQAARACSLAMSRSAPVGSAAAVASLKLGAPNATARVRASLSNAGLGYVRDFLRTLAFERVSVSAEFAQELWALAARDASAEVAGVLADWLAHQLRHPGVLKMAVESLLVGDSDWRFTVDVLSRSQHLGTELVQLALANGYGRSGEVSFIKTLGRADSIHPSVARRLRELSVREPVDRQVYLLAVALNSEPIDPETVSQLLNLSLRVESRFDALSALTRIRGRVAGVEIEMKKLLESDHSLTRATAARVLATQSPIEPGTTELLMRAARSASGFERVTAIRALAAGNREEVEPLLEVLVGSSVSEVSAAACIAILKLGGEPRSVVDVVEFGPTSIQLQLLRWASRFANPDQLPPKVLNGFRRLEQSSDAEIRMLARSSRGAH